MKIKNILWIGLLAGCLVLPTSCKKYLTVEPEGAISEEQTYKNASDAITAVNGVYSLMPPLADQIFLAGELRADLVTDARGADQWIKEFTDNRVTSANPYCDYSKFYRLIIACNKALTGLDDILRNDPVNYNRNVYLSNKAEVYYSRAWAYLQLVKIWGDVPYLTNSVTKVADISSLPVTKGETIIKNIIKDAQDNYAALQVISAASLGSSDAFLLTLGQWRDLNSRCFLSELYLYDQNYSKAYEIITPLFPVGLNPGASGGSELNMITGQATQWNIGLDRGNGNYRYQVVMSLNFDATKGQTNNLMRWTSTKYGGLYAIKPSGIALNNWRTTPMMLQQYQTTAAGYFINEAPGFGTNVITPTEVVDGQGNPIIGGYGDNYRAERGSYMVDGKDTLISKYLMKTRGVYKNPLIGDRYADNDAFFNLYRDGGVYMMGCEIVNALGRSYDALLFINGVNSNYTYKSTRYRVQAYPFKMDATSPLSAQAQVNRFILSESANETAFEGCRWFDLVRFAKRNNDPSILANAVAAKYPAGQQAAIRARLMDPKNWYLPVYKK